MTKLATGDLSLRLKMKMASYAVALLSGFYLFAQYNSRAAIVEGEQYFLLGASVLGPTCLAIEGEIRRRAKRRFDNAIASGENPTHSHLPTRRTSSLTLTTAIILTRHPNPFRDSLYPLQDFGSGS